MLFSNVTVMAQHKLTPDQFLYGRRGPWPQPSPAHPLNEAMEVLTIPPIESMLWNATIGQRYLQLQVGYPPIAAANAVEQASYTTPPDQDFQRMMLETCYQRFLLPLSQRDRDLLAEQPLAAGTAPPFYKYDFSAMELVQPLEGLNCAPTVVYIAGTPGASMSCVAICVGSLLIQASDPAWEMAKAYALQGAAYHILFVVHPALHFPMDSVNAVTKTAIPQAHPLFKLLYPHTSYTLALDNAVLESEFSVVNENAKGTWFDPLTANAYNLKLLFGAGYSGLPDKPYADAYPVFDYMRPALLKLADSPAAPVYALSYSNWLTAYFNDAFLPFCLTVAKAVLAADPHDEFVKRWAGYLKQCVYGFPDEREILDAECLAMTMAIYMWDVSVSHGADHYSFALEVPVPDKFLRIRRPAPTATNDPPVMAGEISTGDDRYRAEMCQALFFMPSAIKPNLNETFYAFTDPVLSSAQAKFHQDLLAVSNDTGLKQFMPLISSRDSDLHPNFSYSHTIPASIQY
jgi:hypothetical protein